MRKLSLLILSIMSLSALADVDLNCEIFESGGSGKLCEVTFTEQNQKVAKGQSVFLSDENVCNFEGKYDLKIERGDLQDDLAFLSGTAYTFSLVKVKRKRNGKVKTKILDSVSVPDTGFMKVRSSFSRIINGVGMSCSISNY